MRIHVARGLDDIRDIKALSEGEAWDHARRFLARVGTDPFAHHLRWLEDEGQPVACVQVFLHRYPIGSARVGLCLPEYPFVPAELRGRGYFKCLMADLFGWMRGAGYPLAYDHGRKGLYTSLGFAPCFHHCMALMRTADALAIRAPGNAERAKPADLAAHEGLIRTPHPLGRGMQCRDERWRPDARDVWIVRRWQRIEAFAVVSRPRATDSRPQPCWSRYEGADVLAVTDAWAASRPAAATVLRAAASEARELNASWLRINCRRDGPLARIAVLAGGQLRWWAAQERDCTEKGEDVDAFYLADLRLAVEQLLPELDARWREFKGPAPSAIRFATEGQQVALRLSPGVTIVDQGMEAAPCVRLPRKAMVRAIMGYATPSELLFIHEGCEVPDETHAAADALFPAREPQLDHEEMAFGGPNRWGLVP